MSSNKKSENNVTQNLFINLPGNKYQPYLSWKFKDKNNKSLFNNAYQGTDNKTYNLGVASDSRPNISILDKDIKLEQNNLFSNQRNFINQRRPISSKNNAKAQANPIKHWRKQLIPNQNFINTKVTVRQAIDTPGGTSALKLDTCKKDEKKKINFIPQYLIRNDVDKHCQKCDKIDEVLDKNGNIVLRENGKLEKDDIKRLRTIEEPKFNKERVRRPASTIVKKNFYQSNSSYLRSRVKKFEQNQTIAPIKGIEYFVDPNAIPLEIRPATDDKDLNKPEGSQNYNSVYCNQFDCNFKHPYQRVIFKPNNRPFQQQGGVDSSLRTFNLQKDAINKSAFFLTEEFGTATANNSRYRGQDEAPITCKTFYQDIPPLGNEDCNIQIRNTQNSGRQLSGGSGRRTNCFRIASNKINKQLGSILQYTKGAGTGLLTRAGRSFSLEDSQEDPLKDPFPDGEP